MNTNIEGKLLAECFSVVSRCGTELASLCDVLNNTFAEKLNDNRLPCVLTSEEEHDDRIDDSGWVYTDEAYSFPLKTKGQRGKSIVEMYLGYQISMSGDGMSLLNNKEPLLHVFMMDRASDFQEDQYLGFPIGDDSENPILVVENRLLVWGDTQPQKWTDREWAFSLRLTALNSPDDLREKIVNPAIKLLQMASATEALPDTIEGLYLYPEKSDQWVECEG